VILTYRSRLKDKSAVKRLRVQASACNRVWNHADAYQKDLESRYHAGAPKRKWPSHFDLQALTKGTSREFGIHAQTVGSVCEQFTRVRDGAKHCLRFRASSGLRRALGRIVFQRQSRQIEGNSLVYLGKVIRWFGNKRRPLPDSAKGGAQSKGGGEKTLGLGQFIRRRFAPLNGVELELPRRGPMAKPPDFK